MEIQGVPVVLDAELPQKRGVTIQVRFPRSRKRRIREKWQWRARNYKRFAVWVLFVTEERELTMHPDTWEWFREVMA